MRNFIKYSFDWIMAFIATLIFLPLLILPIALLIKLTSKGPVLFKQKRIGQNKKTFILYKFRTMKINTPKYVPTHQLKNPEQWITPLLILLEIMTHDRLFCLTSTRFPKLWSLQLQTVRKRALEVEQDAV